jgi:pyruvate decarboxylase
MSFETGLISFQIYVGRLSHPAVREKVESAKLVFLIGSIKSDVNTGSFTYNIPITNTVEVHNFSIAIWIVTLITS